jgi:hypothetical protein
MTAMLYSLETSGYIEETCTCLFHTQKQKTCKHSVTFILVKIVSGTFITLIFILGNWKWWGATLEKGHFSTSKIMKKGNIVIFGYLILNMSFSTTFSALCIYMTHCLYIFYYTDICTETQVKIWISIKRKFWKFWTLSTTVICTLKIIHVWDKCVHVFFKHKNRRLVNTVLLLF